MQGKRCSLGFLLTLLQLSHQVSDKSSSSYVGAVVEYTPTVVRGNGALTLKGNTEAYIGYIESAKKQDADIIVFPEYGLTSLNLPSNLRTDASWTTVVPSAKEEYVACRGTRSDVSETLRQLSCAARNNKIYVVINIAEREPCGSASHQECQSRDADRFYNTNVVFDRNGKIIARYRKINPYMEPFDKPEPPEVVTFDTDFGVKFGTFICFDIMFSVPSLKLTRNLGVTDIAFSTAWISEEPFLTAVQAHYGWSAAEKVNFLESGFHGPHAGHFGSGIYLGRQRKLAAATMSYNPERLLLVRRIPKLTSSSNDAKLKERHEEEKRKKAHRTIEQEQPKLCPANGPATSKGKDPFQDSMFFMHDNLAPYETVPFSDSVDKTVCYKNFCCHFQINATRVDPQTEYRLAVFNGVRLYGAEVTAGVRVCSLIQCSNDSLASCYSHRPSDTTFSTLKITAAFEDYSPEFLVMPSLLNSDLLPFEGWTLDEESADARTNFTLASNKVTKDLAAFAIYVRDFSRDHWRSPAEVSV